MGSVPGQVTDKGSLHVGGQRLVDIVRGQLPYGMPVTVVSPFPLGLPQVCESPLFSGPAAGIAAGFAALTTMANTDHLAFMAVLSVDAPESPRMLPELHAALTDAPQAPVAVTRAADGWLQPLCALWRRDSLGHAITVLAGADVPTAQQPARLAGMSARRLLRVAGSPAIVEGTGAERDYDTRPQLRAYATYRGLAL